MLRALIFSTMALMIGTAGLSSVASALPAKNRADLELLVKFKESASAADEDRAIRSLGSVNRLRNPQGLAKVAHLKLPRGADLDRAIEKIAQDPTVEIAQPNFLYQASTVPNDTHYSKLWGLRNSAQTVATSAAIGPSSVTTTNNPGHSGKDMGLESAWNYITDCSSVVVAVVDSGVKYDHQDLASNMWDGTAHGAPKHGWDLYNNDDDPTDDNGHGTHVAGTIGAVGNNSLGTTGVCWKVKLMAVKVMSATGAGSTATVTAGINWAVARGAKVINLSLGGSGYDALMASAVSNAATSGVVVVSAAGNEGTDNDSAPQYPCNNRGPNTLCVAAVDQTFQKAAFSCYGTTTVDVGAPGVNIVSTVPRVFSKTTDLFSSGWTYSSTTATGWGPRALSSSSGPTTGLTNPKNWNNSTAQYANSTDDRAYKSFTFDASYDIVTLEFSLGYNTEFGKDFVRSFIASGAADPVTAGTLLTSDSGASGGVYLESHDVTSSCRNSTCSVGFQFTSDAANTSSGAYVVFFSFIRQSYGTTGYDVAEGTSMAAPHVSGLAALLKAYHTDFTHVEVVEAIKQSGVSASALAGITTTGKVVNAINALAYIRAPKNVTAAVE